jgi:uncharacterized membrane protein YhaH (DUF805 family)
VSWYFAVLKKYAVFSGRARRKEYWLFTLFNCIISAVLMGFFLLFTRWGAGRPRFDFAGSGHIVLFLFGSYFLILYYLYSLATIVPNIAVGVRRLHDTNLSGWWLLLGLIPGLGSIAVLILLVRDSTPGENRFGLNPKGIGSQERISDGTAIPAG